MGQTNRKAFEDWKTHLVYMNQEGRCKNCGGTLDYGMGTGKPFEKHHSDGNHANNATENLDLLCKPCHMATLAKVDKEYNKRYELYLARKSILFDKIAMLGEKAINKELAGAVLTSAIEILNMEDKKCAEEFDMNRGLFYAPPSIKVLTSYRNIKGEVDALTEGIRIGLSTLGTMIHIKGEFKDGSTEE